MSEPKKCSGFPTEAGSCKEQATAIVLRVPVCAEHAKLAAAKGLRVTPLEQKS